MKIESNFVTVQVSPAGVSAAPRVNCLIDVSDMPERGRFGDRGMLCLCGTDEAWILEQKMNAQIVILVCGKSAGIDKRVLAEESAGRAVIHVDPELVRERVLYAKGYGNPPELFVRVGDADVEPFQGKIKKDEAKVVKAEVVKAVGKPIVAQKSTPAIEKKDKKKKRARNEDGSFKGDDTGTPDVDEAWEKGDS